MDHPQTEPDDLEPMMKDFLNRISAEPLPEELRQLADTLSRKLQDRTVQLTSSPPALL